MLFCHSVNLSLPSETEPGTGAWGAAPMSWGLIQSSGSPTGLEKSPYTEDHQSCFVMAEASSESHDHFSNVAACPGGVLFARLAFISDSMQI